jgi:cysteinyl-tRNA synthetase
MLIYNTLDRKKEEFKPINPPSVSMYVCGPTVYDLFHIGNARSFVMGDMIRRYLEYRGYNVKYVMNLTDVDDKIIKRANEQGVDAKDYAEKYISEFFKDIDGLKVKRADAYPQATHHIDDMIELIKELEKKEIAYNVNGDVFYDVRKFKDYGKLSGKNIDDLESGARIEINENKHNPLDFALWKKAKEGEPKWESPWGKGRPGWHIECSAMSMKELGETIDIHAGGSDLIFPHHENEIAQSEAATCHDFVKYWVHFGFLNIRNEKMSKSLGNFFTTRDVLKKFNAETIRLFFSQTHYAAPLNFSEELLSSTEKASEKIKNLAIKVNEKMESGSFGEDSGSVDFSKYRENFTAAVDDDFNFPKGVAVIFDFVREINREIQTGKNLQKSFYQSVKDFMIETSQNVLGILDWENLGDERNVDSKEEELINLLIEIRTEAKKSKNYALADSIRNRLAEIGITLQDTKDGVTYTIK